MKLLSVQPPSGGCVLKPECSVVEQFSSGPAAFRRLCVETIGSHRMTSAMSSQPPSGGCVLKLIEVAYLDVALNQPPSGGCVLKQPARQADQTLGDPAAFRRLCVETTLNIQIQTTTPPAAFRRLCVETSSASAIAAAITASRLQAAVC